MTHWIFGRVRHRAGRRPCVIAGLALLCALAARPAWSQDAIDDLDDLTTAAGASGQSATGWRGALTDSFRLLMMEHAGRIAFQEKTRRELGGPFFRDYARSVKWPRKWEDGDAWGVNYVGHPIHGAAASRIWLDHTDHDPRFDNTAAYWASRGIAAAWAAGYSMQFEFGPLSEASIGNVGLDPATTGWVDHVITPAGAFAFTVGEDVLDRYFITLVERHTRNRFYRAVIRVIFNPSRSLANVTEGRSPWFRPDRPLR